MKAKILFLVHLAPPVHGAAALGGYVKDSVLINNTFDSKYINLATAGSLLDIGKWNLKKGLVILQLWYKVLKTLVAGKYQLCYMTINSSGVPWYKELVIVVLVKLFGVPIVYHYHNKGVAENATTGLKNFLYRFQFNNAKTIVGSPLLYADVVKFVPPSNVYYCPNGIPAISLPAKHTKIAQPQSNTVHILFLSNLIQSKGVYVLLEACALLQKKSIPFNCIFIGGESDITSVKFNDKVQELNLQQNVSYQGKKYGTDKQLAFSEADIFAFPTYYHNECFPLVILEAMQQALPVVSTFEGGVPDFVADTVSGFLVPQQNAQALADKLETLILNPNLRTTMGLAGKKLYQQKYTVEIYENTIKEILADALIKLKNSNSFN
jgi:glycosyltransferase involved in cell wall biosynthesis